jgi:hypothetical protein
MLIAVSLPGEPLPVVTHMETPVLALLHELPTFNRLTLQGLFVNLLRTVSVDNGPEAWMSYVYCGARSLDAKADYMLAIDGKTESQPQR